jgi:hypothetical protein
LFFLLFQISCIVEHFKNIIFITYNNLASVGPWNFGQRSNMNRFLNSLGKTTYTLSILFFAKTPIVKLLSIEIATFHICTLDNIIRKIGHRKLPWTNLRKDIFEIMKLPFVQFWHLWFWGRFLKIDLFV